MNYRKAAASEKAPSKSSPFGWAFGFWGQKPKPKAQPNRALGFTAAAAGDASAADTHAAAAPWFYAACSDSHWGSTVIAFAPAWSDCHYLNDSSIIA